MTAVRAWLWVCLAILVGHSGLVIAEDGRVATVSLESMHSALRERRFEELERQVLQAQAEYESNVDKEDQVAELLRSFAIADPDIEDGLNDWVRMSPRSYASRSMRGMYRLSMAWGWRGHGWYAEIHPTRLGYMNDYLKGAYEDFQVAIHLSARPGFAFARLIEIARMAGPRDMTDELLKQATAVDPQAVGPYAAYLDMLLPRWGGSYEAMASFAEKLATSEYPKLKKYSTEVRAAILSDRADILERKGDLAGALHGYQEALAQMEAPSTLGRLARAYGKLGQTDNVARTLDRCLVLSSRDKDCLRMRADLRFLQKRGVEGLADLRQVAFLGDLYAARQLGFILAEGSYGIPMNVDEGMRWMNRAAYFWDTEALYQLGQAYERGEGVPVDFAKAILYYRACANLLNAMCENNLGMLLWYGKGGTSDPEQAIRLWHRVAKKGVWQGGHNLNYFLSPWERIRVIVTLGPGKWASDLIMVIVAILLGSLAILWILLRRRWQKPIGHTS